MEIVKSNGESIDVVDDKCEFDLEKLKASTLNKLDAYVKRVLISRVKPGRSETGRRGRDSKQAVDSPVLRSEKRAPSENEQYAHPDDHEHYICPSMKRLRNKVCFICGHFGNMYGLNDSLRNSFETRFGFKIDIQYFTPNQLCGGCRAILLADGRQFKFVRPMQWAPASNHLVYESNCDCYFCKANANPEFFRTKTRENLPQDTTCTLPELVSAEADEQKHRVENTNHIVDPNHEWTTAYDGHQSDQTNSTQPAQNEPSTNGCCSIGQLRDEMRTELVQIKNDMLFICNQMDKKKLDISELHKDLEEIKNQQKLIIDTISVTNLLLLQNSQLTLPTDGQFDNSPDSDQKRPPA